MSKPVPVVALVDDDTAARKSLARIVTLNGYIVKEYESAEEYVASDTSTVCCAIIDVNLGGAASGLDLGRIIAQSANPIPLIFMTGSARPHMRAEASALSSVALLEKPFPATQLLGAIAQACGTRG